MTHEEKARNLFMEGYNCAQAVVLAFEEELGIDRETLLKLSSSFGGGLGRLREVCGCVSGIAFVTGALRGYSDPKASDEKAALYALIQELAARFREENGSIICRELLSQAAKTPPEAVATVPQPEPRTAGYYKKRPCPDLVASAARILEERFF